MKEQYDFTSLLRKPALAAAAGAMSMALLIGTIKGSPPPTPVPASPQVAALAATLKQTSTLLAAQAGRDRAVEDEGSGRLRRCIRDEGPVDWTSELVEDLRDEIGQVQPPADAAKATTTQFYYRNARLDRIESLLKRLDAKEEK